MIAFHHRFASAAAVLAASMLLAGCGGGSTVPEGGLPASESQRRLSIIGDVYLRSTMRLNRAPKSLDDIQPAIKDQKLKLDDILKSPDDGQAYEIVWGSDLRGLQATGSDIPIIAFERSGKDGKRHVLRGRSEVLLMTESELRSAKFPDGYKLPF